MATRSYGYEDATRYGVGLGVGMLLLGVAGHLLVPLVSGPLPAWEGTLFTDLEILGVVLGMVAFIGFGIVGPLVE